MTIDFTNVPLVALSDITKQSISMMLNPKLYLKTENGLPRDWRGLSFLLDFDTETNSFLVSHPDPTNYILGKRQKIMIQKFLSFLERIDRWDIIDDTKALLESDALRYIEAKTEQPEQQKIQVSSKINQEALTSDDVDRLWQGLEIQDYDAFLLYADEDDSFANEMRQKLEKEHKLKLCIKDRDLLVGLNFEHEAIMKLINRCHKLVAIISPSFLESAANEFFLNYTQALCIEKRKTKIIPCLYKNCEIPMQLKYMSILKYNLRGCDFWTKLYKAIQCPNPNVTCTRQKVIEVTNILPVNRNCVSQIYKENSTVTSDNRNCVSQIYQGNTVTPEYSQTIENKEINDMGASKNKKNKTLLQWMKSAVEQKTKEIKSNNKPVIETVGEKQLDLPSLDNLDSLNISTDIICEKKKSRFSKFTKMRQMKKIMKA